jgi:uncharacterized protein YkwD
MGFWRRLFQWIFNPTPSPAPPGGRPTGRLLDLINGNRETPLTLLLNLENAARENSAWQSEHRMVGHAPDFGGRMRRHNAGFPAAENAASGTSDEDVFGMWMNSQGHRKNMLSPQYNFAGYAEVDGYWTLCLSAD